MSNNTTRCTTTVKQPSSQLSSIPVYIERAPTMRHGSTHNTPDIFLDFESLLDEFDEECVRRGGKDGCEYCSGCFLMIF